MASGGRRRRRTGLALAVLLLTGWATLWLVARGTRGAEIATVIAIPLSVLSLLGALFDVKLVDGYRLDRDSLWGASQALAREVAAAEAVERNRLLADKGHATAADVGFHRFEPHDPDEALVLWRDDGGSERGTLAEIAKFYTELNRGRLVVLGAPGAGKTVLTNQLLLDLIEGMPREDLGPATPVRVPVRLNLAAFDPGPDADVAQPGELAARLDSWIAKYLRDVYGLPASVATRLTRDRWVLPVLDGLDEMDLEGPHASRASALARALNHPDGTSLRPVVVTCREARYLQLARQQSEVYEIDVLQDATVVELQPLTIAQVKQYLIRRFPARDDRALVSSRWRQVVRHIDDEPNGPLADALRSPLGLFLAMTGYHRNDSRPEALIGQNAADLDRTLFDELVPAACRRYPRWFSDRDYYKPEDVTRWLGTLADHLQAEHSRGRSAADLDLRRLWAAAGARVPRYRAAAAQAITLAVPVLLFWGFDNHVSRHPHFPGWLYLILSLVSTTAVFACAWRRATKPAAWIELDPGLGRPASIFRMVGLFIVGFCLASAFMMNGLAYRDGGLAAHDYEGEGLFGFVVGLVAALMFGARALTATGRLQRLFVRSVRFDLVLATLASLVAGSGVLIDELPTRISPALIVVTGLEAGLGTWFLRSPWPLYFSAVETLRRRELLPVDNIRFLDWACEAGLLRLSGIAVQFRHRRLQQYLQTTPTATQGPVPPINSTSTAHG